MRRLAPLALLLAGCIHRPQLVHFDQPTPISVVVLLDQKDGTQLQDLPPELGEALGRELEKRNLVGAVVPAAQLRPLGQNRNSRTRAELLAQIIGPDQRFLLVELKADFFGQFEGGYKWNVDGVLTAARGNALLEATSAPFGLTAFLERESEGAKEALVQASSGIAERAGTLLDEHFGGRTEGANLATPPSEPPAPAPSR
jgi:hypothetical protein